MKLSRYISELKVKRQSYLNEAENLNDLIKHIQSECNHEWPEMPVGCAFKKVKWICNKCGYTKIEET